MDMIRADECGVRSLTFAAVPNNIIQWSIPMGFRAVIQAGAQNANDVFISTDDPNTAGALTPAFSLVPLAPGAAYQDRIVFPSGYPGPIYFSGTGGEGVTIFIMPCGESAY
jgi:hypothetical protein